MKLLVIDDHPLVRRGLVSLLDGAMPGTAVFEAADAETALALLSRHTDLDAVLLDLFMPGMGGLAALSEFAQARPDLPVVVLSSSERPEDVRSAMAHGALGYVPKSASPQTLLAALRLVLDGEVYVPRLMLDDDAPDPAPAPGSASLTERQVEILRCLGEGLSNKAIARRLMIAEKTVKGHVTTIFRALHVLNRTQAVVSARTAGIV